MNKESFTRIVSLLESNDVFKNNSKRKQAPVWVQCVVAFHRFGCDGHGNSIFQSTHFQGLSHGSIVMYTNRVMKALIDIGNDWCSWPKANEREAISNRFKNKLGLSGAVGILDGTLVHFSQKPAVKGDDHRTGKNRYSINVQLLCDDLGKIIYYQVGWPGSVSDYTAFSSSQIESTPQQYFTNGEYLLADCNYNLNSYTITPYTQPLAAQHKVFNDHLSSARVNIEQVKGVWKSRFTSLKNLRIQVKKEEDFITVCNWIVCTIILYNMLISFSDNWDNDDNEVDESMPHVHSDSNNDGRELRNQVESNLLKWLSDKSSSVVQTSLNEPPRRSKRTKLY
eukprot:gene17634-23212_t